MEEMKSTQLTLKKNTIRTLTPAEGSGVAGGAQSWYTQYCETYQWYSCGDPHSVVVPHTCYICY